MTKHNSKDLKILRAVIYSNVVLLGYTDFNCEHVFCPQSENTFENIPSKNHEYFLKNS